jgi:hypothetical protein
MYLVAIHVGVGVPVDIDALASFSRARQQANGDEGQEGCFDRAHFLGPLKTAAESGQLGRTAPGNFRG